MDFQLSMGVGLKKTSPHSELQAGNIRHPHLLLLPLPYESGASRGQVGFLSHHCPGRFQPRVRP